MRRFAMILAMLLFPTVAWAQSCSFGVSTMNFGSVDTLSGSPNNSTATLTVNCTGLLLTRILICPNLGTGSGGATGATRHMLSGANLLNYQLYSDSGRSVVWGSYAWPSAPTVPGFALTLDLGGSGSASRTIYGAVLGGQATAVPGTYLSTFSGTHVEFRYRASVLSNDCSTSAGSVDRPTFTINATVPANCLLAIQNIDFGSTGILGANVDATGGVGITCTPGTPYTVSLNNGTTGTAPAARKMSKAGETVTYGLYKDNARSQVWGDAATPGSTVAGTGSGAVQNLTVYGRVPAQTTPSAGLYTDTVVVTVTY